MKKLAPLTTAILAAALAGYAATSRAYDPEESISGFKPGESRWYLRYGFAGL
ncbi:hypothetical protein SAMN04487951_12148 [Vreelandella arcis]|uniref:Uncharacterized protein n=1 Tax=Vreelandella arcis TaxID=416873 RepID=A0A1H0IR67_9GAMM|nr:hypothetical protein SAMN04487951_12148 [Halomonas arcis]